MSEEYEADPTVFTIVFSGDIRKLPFNPLNVESVYGRPVAAGIGNAFDEVESMADFLPPETLDDLSDAERYMIRLKTELSERTSAGVFRKVLAMAKAAVVEAQEPTS